MCSLCEQNYHGAVMCALGWACWKTYVGRPEADTNRCWAMRTLGNSLSDHNEDALSVQEAELSMLRRRGAPESDILGVQCNLANTIHSLGRFEEALQMDRDIYSGYLKLTGKQSRDTLEAALNFADSLVDFERFAEIKSLLQEVIPMARRVFGENNIKTLKMRWLYAFALFKDDSATLADLREAVTTLETIANSWNRVLGPAHPETLSVQAALGCARDTLRERETSSGMATRTRAARARSSEEE